MDLVVAQEEQRSIPTPWATPKGNACRPSIEVFVLKRPVATS
jgi:hypothetical protein